MTENELIWGLNPDEDNWQSGGDVSHWTTKCQRYRLYRIKDTCPSRKDPIKWGACCRDSGAWWSCENTDLGHGYPKYYDSPEKALLVMEKHLTRKLKCFEIKSNKQELLDTLEPPKIAPESSATSLEERILSQLGKAWQTLPDVSEAVGEACLMKLLVLVKRGQVEKSPLGYRLKGGSS